MLTTLVPQELTGLPETVPVRKSGIQSLLETVGRNLNKGMNYFGNSTKTLMQGGVVFLATDADASLHVPRTQQPLPHVRQEPMDEEAAKKFDRHYEDGVFDEALDKRGTNLKTGRASALKKALMDILATSSSRIELERAAFLSGEFEFSETVPLLIPCLRQTQNFHLRRIAGDALVKFTVKGKSHEAAQALAEALHDPNLRPHALRWSKDVTVCTKETHDQFAKGFRRIFDDPETNETDRFSAALQLSERASAQKSDIQHLLSRLEEGTENEQTQVVNLLCFRIPPQSEEVLAVLIETTKNKNLLLRVAAGRAVLRMNNDSDAVLQTALRLLHDELPRTQQTIAADLAKKPVLLNALLHSGNLLQIVRKHPDEEVRKSLAIGLALDREPRTSIHGHEQLRSLGLQLLPVDEK